MKKAMLSISAFLILTGWALSQPQASEVVDKLGTIEDQFGDLFTQSEQVQELKFICVQSVNTSFRDVFGKFRGKQTDPNVQVIAGWGDVMTGASKTQKRNHMSPAIAAPTALGPGSYSLYMDFDSEIVEMLNLNQYSLVTLSLSTGDVTVEDYGSDRAAFLGAIRNYFN